MSYFYPFDSLIRLADLSDDIFEVPKSRRGQKVLNQPRMDLIDGKDTLTALVELPGISKENVNISLQNNVLTISGHVEHTEESKAEGSAYKFTERSYGHFTRSLVVPSGIKESEIKANLTDGLLKVEIPKVAKEAATKKIAIS